MTRAYAILGLAAALAAGCAPATTGAGEPAGSTRSGSSAAAARLTPEDLDALMKKIDDVYHSAKGASRSGRTQDVGTRAGELAELFGDVEKFWAQQNVPRAVRLAEQARTSATEAAGHAAAGNLSRASAALRQLDGACEQCHSAYRQPDGQGGFRLKSGAISPPSAGNTTSVTRGL